jgi:type II secretory pathway pseudopilin PulG
MRGGFSLIELLVAIAGASVVFTVLAVSLYTLQRAQKAVQEESHAAAALHDFARQLRNDAHAAEKAALAEANGAGGAETDSVTLFFDDGREAVYDFNSEMSLVRRRVVQNEQTASRESYVLPRGSRVQWQITGEGVMTLIAKVSRAAGATANPSWRTTRIEAAVGLDRGEVP